MSVHIVDLNDMRKDQLIDLVESLELTVEHLDKEILEMKAAIKGMDVTSAYKDLYS